MTKEEFEWKWYCLTADSLGNRTDTPIMREEGIGQVIPQRYVWHVGQSTCAEVAASIERYGLMAGYSGKDAVFANNQSLDPRGLYPIAIEHVCFKYPEIRDIWRIDTKKCKVRWYADVCMYGYAIPDWSKNIYWIFTPSNIPPGALKRYRILPNPEADRFLIKKGDGVTSFIGPRLSIAPFPWRDDADEMVWERAA